MHRVLQIFVQCSSLNFVPDTGFYNSAFRVKTFIVGCVELYNTHKPRSVRKCAQSYYKQFQLKNHHTHHRNRYSLKY